MKFPGIQKGNLIRKGKERKGRGKGRSESEASTEAEGGSSTREMMMVLSVVNRQHFDNS